MIKKLLSLYVFLCIFFTIDGEFTKVSASEINKYMLLDETKEIPKTVITELCSKDISCSYIEEVGLLEINGEAEAVKKKLNKIEMNLNNSMEVGELPSLDAALEFHQANMPSWGLDGITELEHYLWFAKKQTDDYASYEIEPGNSEVKIAVIDSGVDSSHPDLKNIINIKDAKDYTNHWPFLQDNVGHGTQVAGMINIIAPSISITPYKVLDIDGGESFNVIRAIIDATKDKNHIITVSSGSFKVKGKENRFLLKVYQKAVDYAKKNNVLLIASAGNEGLNLDEYEKKTGNVRLPGGLKSIITIGATTKNEMRAPYSNYGKDIFATAPGGYFGDFFDSMGIVDVTSLMLTTYPSYMENTLLDTMLNIPKGYSLSFGTSLAAPQAAATSALIISRYRDMKGVDPKIGLITRILKDSTNDLGEKGKDIEYGYGEIDTMKAIQVIEKKVQ